MWPFSLQKKHFTFNVSVVPSFGLSLPFPLPFSLLLSLPFSSPLPFAFVLTSAFHERVDFHWSGVVPVRSAPLSVRLICIAFHSLLRASYPCSLVACRPTCLRHSGSCGLCQYCCLDCVLKRVSTLCVHDHDHDHIHITFTSTSTSTSTAIATATATATAATAATLTLTLTLTHYALRITHYALRITHYALCITHYALRITHYALRVRLPLRLCVRVRVRVRVHLRSRSRSRSRFFVFFFFQKTLVYYHKLLRWIGYFRPEINLWVKAHLVRTFWWWMVLGLS